VEAKRFLTDDARVEDEARRLKTLAAAWVAAVEDRHVVFFSHLVDGCKEADEVLLCVDVLFAVGTQEDVFTLLKAEACMNIRVHYFFKVLVEDFRHWRA